MLLALVIGFFVGIFTKSTTENDNLSEQEPTKTKIGAILPLTGDFGYPGTQIRRGMEMGLADYGNKNIEIIFEDDETFMNSSAVRASNKLINIDGIDVLFNSVVSTVKALDPIVHKNDIPTLVIWDNNRTISSLQGPVFGYGYSNERTGEKLAEHAFNTLGLRNISVVSLYDEWSEIISLAFIDKFEERGGMIDLHEKVNIGESDFKSVIKKIISANSDAIYFPLFGVSETSLIKQANELSFNGYLLTAEGLSTSDLQYLNNVSTTIYATQPWVDDEEFYEKYKSLYNDDVDPIHLGLAGLGYDAVKLIANLIGELESENMPVNKYTIREHLIDFESVGVTGSTKFDKYQNTDKVQSIVVVRNGKFELIEK